MYSDIMTDTPMIEKKTNKQKCQKVKNEIEMINIWGCFPFNAILYVTEGANYFES